MTNEKINILVTDDNPSKLEQIAAILEDAGINIVKATSGEEAIEKANTINFALIILDVKMPGINGFEAANLIRRDTINASTPIIFITGSSFSNQDVFKGYQAGGVDYLTNPVNPVILKSKATIFIELYRKSQKLEQMFNNQDRFYNIIAHDLRSPFNPLLGVLNILTNEFDTLSTLEIKEFIGMMSQSADNLFALLTDLLEMASLKSDDFVYSPAKVNTREIVENAFSLLGENDRKKGITLLNKVPEKHTSIADKIMLQVVIRNLVSNALKFTPKTGEISIECYETDDIQKIYVRDTGLGIPAEHLDKLFRKEIKYTTSGTDGEVGTGLGLPICMELMEKQNGTISVESEPGKGTTFTVSLPKNFE